MRRTLVALLLLMMLGALLAQHHHRQSLRPYLLEAPSPPLSSAEVGRDGPSDAEFASAHWQPISELQAEAFSVLDRDYHCVEAWRDAVAHRDKGDRLEQAQLPGRAGLADWIQSRIVRPDGSVAAALTRPGPRHASGT